MKISPNTFMPQRDEMAGGLMELRESRSQFRVARRFSRVMNSLHRHLAHANERLESLNKLHSERSRFLPGPGGESSYNNDDASGSNRILGQIINRIQQMLASLTPIINMLQNQFGIGGTDSSNPQQSPVPAPGNTNSAIQQPIDTPAGIPQPPVGGPNPPSDNYSESPKPPSGNSVSPSPPSGNSASPSPPGGNSASPSPPGGNSVSPGPPSGNSASPSPPSSNSASPSPPSNNSASPSPASSNSASPSPPSSNSASPSPPGGNSASPSPPSSNPASNNSTPISGDSGYTPFAGDPFQNSAAFLDHMQQAMLRPAPVRQPGDPVYDLLNSPDTSIPPEKEFDVNASPPTARELEQLTEKYGGIEWAVAHVQGRGLVLASGRPDGINPPGNRNTALKVVHTHPRDNGKGASNKDVEKLANFRSQDKAFVITVGSGDKFGVLQSYTTQSNLVDSISL